MAATITVGGLATGLDTNSIIDQLVKIEHQPVDLLTQQQSETQANQNSIATLGQKLAALKAAADALRTPDDVLVRQASSSDDNVVTAAAGGGAPRGTTTLTITQLAHGSVAGATIGLASTDALVAAGAGTFQFQSGSGDVQSIAVDGTTTLQQLVNAINDTKAGVTASAVNLGTDESPDYRLELVSQSTGATSTITIVHDDTSLAVETTQAGQDAQFSVDGFSGTFSRSSNTFSGVLPGVTFTASSVGTATVTVTDDTDAIVKKAQALAAAFNDAIAFVDSESTVAVTDDKNDAALGTLATDSTARRIVSRLHAVFSESVAGLTGRSNLSSLGFATNKDTGQIDFDAGKFTAALSADPDGVAAVFAGAGDASGVAGDLSSLIDGTTAADGALSTHARALGDQIRSLQDQIDAGQRKVDAFEADLRQQFASLETLVSGLNSQGSFLQSALSAKSA